MMEKFEGNISIRLPELKIETETLIIDIKENKVIVEGDISKEEFQRLLQSIEDNFWEYQVAQRMNEGLKNMIAMEYFKISPSLGVIVRRCDIRQEGGVVVIYVPDELEGHVGRLIGKEGRNVKTVGERLSIYSRIVQSNQPEEVVMKRRLEELMRRLIG